MVVSNMSVVYGFIKFASLIIRQFYLPNPFEMFDYGVIYNLIATGFLVPITYIMVGFLYERRSVPFVGSLLFFIVYLLNTLVIWLFTIFSFNILACITIVLVYLVMFMMFIRLKNSVMGVY
jgi:hypothetical protein